MSLKTKEELRKLDAFTIREQAIKDAWIAIHRYYNGAGNGPEADFSVVAIAAKAKEMGAENGRKALDVIIEKLNFQKEVMDREVKQLNK